MSEKFRVTLRNAPGLDHFMSGNLSEGAAIEFCRCLSETKAASPHEMNVYELMPGGDYREVVFCAASRSFTERHAQAS